MNRYLIFSLISIGIAVIVYIALDSLLYSLPVFIIYLLVAFLLLIPKLKKHSFRVMRFHECYHFINNFIIALSIKKSISGAMESTVSTMPSEFIEVYDSIENQSEMDKLNYLSDYFGFDVYLLFLQIIELWQDEGGDILAYSKHLISESQYNEEYISKVEANSKKKVFELVTLWAFCLVILVFLRFSLQDFYQHIKGQIFFIVSILIFSLFVLFSIFLLVVRMTKIDLKGKLAYEKKF